MAVSIGVLFNPAVLPGAATPIYTVPATPLSTTLINGRVRFTNTTGAPATITWYAVPSGGAPGAGNTQMAAESLAANAHIDVDVPLMGAGATLQALCGTASAITISALAGILMS